MEETKRDEGKNAETRQKETTPTHQPMVNEENQNKDRAGAEPDNDGAGDTEDDEEKDSLEDGSEENDSNDAFDVEDTADDEEEKQEADEIIPDRRQSEESDGSTARHRNVLGDKDQ